MQEHPKCASSLLQIFELYKIAKVHNLGNLYPANSFK
jgi:hypothetical protein